MTRACFFAMMLCTACGGIAGGDPADASSDRSVADAGAIRDATIDSCAGQEAGGCWAKPLSCLPPPHETLAEAGAEYDGLTPTAPCPDGTVWTERYESCGLVAIHAFAGPPSTHWFDGDSGALVGVSISDDTGCSGYGEIEFPCNGSIACTHLCGPWTGTIEPPHCPPQLDAGAD